jgi:two-component system KDP operon response regulator KdpE
MKSHPRALIIDEEHASQVLLRRLLESHDFLVSLACDGVTGIGQAASARLDCIILEPDLPDMDGLTALRRLRQCCQAPILVLSRRNAEDEIVAALDAGADDYMVKPFGPLELLARLRVLLRGLPPAPHDPLLVKGGWSVDFTEHVVTFKDRRITFTAIEEALFYTLLQNEGRMVTCASLLDSIWGRQRKKELRSLRVYIAKIREKLQSCDDCIAIHTQYSSGYKLVFNPASRAGCRPPECQDSVEQLLPTPGPGG